MTDRNVAFAMQFGDPGAVNDPPQQQHQQQPSPGAAPGTQPSWSKAKSWMVGWRGSRQLVLVIVAIALLLDNMLLTVVGKCDAVLMLRFLILGYNKRMFIC